MFSTAKSLAILTKAGLWVSWKSTHIWARMATETMLTTVAAQFRPVDLQLRRSTKRSNPKLENNDLKSFRLFPRAMSLDEARKILGISENEQLTKEDLQKKYETLMIANQPQKHPVQYMGSPFLQAKIHYAWRKVSSSSTMIAAERGAIPPAD